MLEKEEALNARISREVRRLRDCLQRPAPAVHGAAHTRLTHKSRSPHTRLCADH